MSNIKYYAKLAKERMKSGFWQDAQKELQQQKQVAATMGVDCAQASKNAHDRIVHKITSPESYVEEQQFYEKVVAIVTSKTVITNPLSILADKEHMATLTAHEKQAYLLKLSSKYQQAVERYNLMSKKGAK